MKSKVQTGEASLTGDCRSIFLKNTENDFIKSNDNRNFPVRRSCQEQPAGLR